MSQQTTIRKLAELVNTPVDKLLEQLAEAGMRFDGPDQVVTSIEKVKLLGFLKRAHGKADKAVDDAAAPKKITLSRSRKQEITVGGGKNRSTVDVVVRKKVTLVKPVDGARAEAGAAAGKPQDDERTEILRKLEESRQRNLSEQQRLAEADQRRAEEAAERKRVEEEAARAEAERVAAALPVAEEDLARKAHGHGHPKPAAPRVDDKGANHKHKTRGSHAMVAGVEDDDRTSRFAGQMHLSAAAGGAAARPGRPGAMPSRRVRAAASPVPPRRSCAKWRSAMRSPWPTWRRSSRSRAATWSRRCSRWA